MIEQSKVMINFWKLPFEVLDEEVEGYSLGLDMKCRRLPRGNFLLSNITNQN